MTAGDERRFPRNGYPPSGPPWSTDVLADLHAGVFDDRLAARLWPAVTADVEAAAVLAALDATQSDLAALSDAPPMPMPENFSARLDAALTAEVKRRSASQPARRDGPRQAAGASRAVARRRSRRQHRFLGWGGGLVAAAAAVAAVVLISVPGMHSTPGHGVAAPSAGSADGGHAPLALSSGGLDQAVLGKALRRHDAGAFADQQKLAGCLMANSIAPESQVVSMAQVTMNGKPATLMVLTTGQSAKFRLLVVSNSCSDSDAATLGNTVVGPR
ncbi:MAG: hypothetical protein ACRDRN_18830 [Sciscionella sp.]